MHMSSEVDPDPFPRIFTPSMFISHSTVAIPIYTGCVYRDCYGLSPLKTIYKDILHFHFQFEVDFTFNDIKVKNV